MERLTLLSALFLFSTALSKAGSLWQAEFPDDSLSENELGLIENESAEPEVPINHTKSFSHKRFRIMGGSEAIVGEFPWQVSLQRLSGRHFCGGSILDETHIITACHCLLGETARGIRIVAGAHNMKNKNESTQQRKRVKEMLCNPNYNEWVPPIRNIDFDSAVIHLKKPLKFNKYVKPMRLPPLKHEPSGNCVASGWGNANPIGFGPFVIPDYLKKVNTIVVPRNLCRIPYLFGTISWLSDEMLCGTNGFLSGTCEGDSGGPLICFDLPNDPKPYLAGLTSFGVPPCNNWLYPSVYTNVARQRDFIDKQLRVTPPPPMSSTSSSQINITMMEL